MAIRLLALLATLTAISSPAQTYNITDLGTLGGPFAQANGIGGWGQVVGQAETDDDNYHAFIFSGSSMQDIGEGTLSAALAINAASQVAGYYYDHGYRAFLWTDGHLTDLGNLGATYSVAYALNNSGQVVGSSGTKEKDEHAFLYSDGQMIDLGTLGGTTSTARSINASGQITGYAYDPDWNFLAFLWENGSMVSLGTLGGDWSKGNAINDAGQIVGQAYLHDNEKAHAFLYTGGKMQDLGELGGNYSNALALNSTGTEIVGYAAAPTGRYGDTFDHAFLYSSGRMKDLNALVPQRSGWTLVVAAGIDDTGQIVGYGLYRGEQHAFLLTPRL
jgi:probable HAF family extracellular repeat protein